MATAPDDTFIGAFVAKYKREHRVLLGPWRIKPLRWMASAAVEWKPQDLWVGAFWKKRLLSDGAIVSYDLWVCVIPCLPIHLWWYREHA